MAVIMSYVTEFGKHAFQHISSPEEFLGFWCVIRVHQEVCVSNIISLYI